MYDDYNYGKVIVKRQDEPKESVEVKILKKLERLRKTLPVGNPKSNIPVFDPFYIKNISVDYSIPNLRFVLKHYVFIIKDRVLTFVIIPADSTV